jgi:6-phosphofructokinase 1
MVLELMGRDAGFIALRAGVSGGADVILIPEIPFDFDCVVEAIQRRVDAGRHFSIVAVAEGAFPAGGQQTYKELADESYAGRLGGVAQDVGRVIEEKSGLETRVTVLGHLQRGGSPTSFDRWLATRFGAAAFRLANAGGYGRMVGLKGTEIVDVSMAEALAQPKRVDLNGDAVLTADQLGICLGQKMD